MITGLAYFAFKVSLRFKYEGVDNLVHLLALPHISKYFWTLYACQEVAYRFL